MTVSQMNLPVVDIHTDNVVQYWPALTLAIQSSTFVALDLEMSGIGNRKDTMARCTEARYKAFSEIAKTRSVLSLGISTFQRKTGSDLNENNGTDMHDNIKHEKNSDFTVQTFNVMVLNNDSFMVDPSSLRFLVEHGFDFNKQYAKGIPYCKDDIKGSKGHDVYSISNLFSKILKATKPVILHNGIFDLVFLYQSFYADLPSTSLAFLADLSEMFPAGIFDTKYIAEYHTENKATFLNYVFKKSWRANLRHEADLKGCVTIKCVQYPSTADVSYNEIINKSPSSDGFVFIPCEQYAAHGHCPKGMKCAMSHDVDVILDFQEQKKEKKEKKRKRKRKRKEMSVLSPNLEEDRPQDCQENSSSAPALEACEDGENSPVTPVATTTNCTNTASGNHRAGFDAFMTGFSMATFLHWFEKSRELSMIENLPDFANKLNLSGKDIPLTITKSQYSKTSMNHKEAWKKVMAL